MSCCLLAELTV